MLFTPEMSGLLDRDPRAGGANPSGWRRMTKCSRPCRDAAHEHGIWVHLGSLAVRTEGGKLANRGVRDRPARARSGRATTRSICSTSTCRPARAGARCAVYKPAARRWSSTGRRSGKLGLTICYDLRFPALFARLAEAGADVIAVPAAFTVPTGQAHWQVLLRARAIEAGLFVVAAAQAGRHEDGRDTYGHSLVVDPWGEVLLDMGEAPASAFAEIDLGRIADVRSRVPALSHRRPIDEAVAR